MPYKDKEKQRIYQVEWIAKRRQTWVDENGPCAECGSQDNLEVDHVDREHKRMQISAVWSLSPSNPKRINELAKCQVLCQTCHNKKTNREIGVPHGGGARGKKNCDCIDCKSQKRLYDKNWARKNRSKNNGL